MYSVFKLHRSNDDWLALKGQILAVWGIFNPNGPTLNFLGLSDTHAEGSDTEVFWRFMHFITGESSCLGYLNTGQHDWQESFAEIIQNGFSGDVDDELCPVTCVPSFVILAGTDVQNQIILEAFSNTEAVRNADWGDELYYLDKYGDRLFERAGEETREAYENIKAGEFGESTYLGLMWAQHAHIPSFTDWQPDSHPSSPYTEAAFRHWLEIAASVEYGSVALAQLCEAWVGAAYRRPHDLQITTDIEDVQAFMQRFDLPVIPASVSTEGLLTKMELATEPSDGSAQDVGTEELLSETRSSNHTPTQGESDHAKR